EAGGLVGRRLDAVVVAVKTPHLAPVVDALRPLAGSVPIVVYQNGLGNERFVGQRLGTDLVLRTAINYAGVPKGPGRIEMTFFHPPNQVGCICGGGICREAEAFAADLTAAGLETEATDDIARFTWRKTILNAALSPVSALLGWTMAEVMDHPHARRLVEALLEESIAVARRAGYDFGDGFFAACVDYLARAGHHRPSMLVDLDAGRPTEIDFINGGIASRARELGVAAPLNEAMTALVHARESSGRAT
ncbi:MAG: ketopantoate reductase family protein, partial [Nitrospirae bacterium]